MWEEGILYYLAADGLSADARYNEIVPDEDTMKCINVSAYTNSLELALYRIK